MCKCNSGRIKRDNSYMARRANSRVRAVYSNPALQGAIKVFSGLDVTSPSGEYLGVLAHGSFVNVPNGIIDEPRSDGSTFVLPDEFVPAEITIEDYGVIEREIEKKPRKKRIRPIIEA